MAALESSMPSSMLTSIIWAPASTCWRATSTAASKSSSRIRRAKRAEPVTLVRSPTLTNSESASTISGSSPDALSPDLVAGIARGASDATASRMAAMWSGVVPQQPPTRLTKPLRANSPKAAAMSSGVWS